VPQLLLRRILRPRTLQPPAEPLFQHLNDDRRIPALWFAQQQVYVLRHDHIADNHEPITSAYLLQDFDEEIAPPRRPQHRSSLITAEGDEMQVASAVISFKTCGHTEIVESPPSMRCDG